MSPSLKRIIRYVMVVFVIVLLGVSIWLNQPGTDEQESEDITPPIDAPDEAGRLIQKASQHYFYHEFDQAAESYQKAISLYESQKDLKRAAKTYESLGDLYKFANDGEKARENYIHAVNYHARLENVFGEARSMVLVGDLYMERDDLNPAGEWYQKAADLVKDQKPDMIKAKVYEMQGQYFWKARKLPEAIDAFSKAQETFAVIGYGFGYEHMDNVIERVKREEAGYPNPPPLIPHPPLPSGS